MRQAKREKGGEKFIEKRKEDRINQAVRQTVTIAKDFSLTKIRQRGMQRLSSRRKK